MEKQRKTVEHAPSSVATLCDYGILPFGLRHSGCPSGQNRITGAPGSPTGLRGRGFEAADTAVTCWFCRSFSGASRPLDGKVWTFRQKPGSRPTVERESTRLGERSSGRTDPYTPHPGLRARVRRARAYEPPLRGDGPTVDAEYGRGARPPLNQEWPPSTNKRN
ncbi:hypothetical protein DEJ51_22470 [Streptomyces venezuelae]|uniref:Uncharacterized protein n=1 Tax=Streptomyces venezuelae TaxID=54571 RepID=A0A5P2DPX5_STRVZ|nr:hypothetical protein DEJ51_22470 [Streptomyces venezuelae]